MSSRAPPATGPVRRSTYAPASPWAKPVEAELSWIPTDLGNGRTLWTPPPGSRSRIR